MAVVIFSFISLVAGRRLRREGKNLNAPDLYSNRSPDGITEFSRSENSFLSPGERRGKAPPSRDSGGRRVPVTWINLKTRLLTGPTALCPLNKPLSGIHVGNRCKPRITKFMLTLVGFTGVQHIIPLQLLHSIIKT
ncbi:hypothetical protein EVAR_47206_1 [Eumeta japonica]|uniref:Uncharacterized protein n=1 Tax=Eumeta variegata TaxID=151549 RepID=A0A4C1XX76_EUMVA|nr:hypothetical protein EVAR_47206_1 [Eumeta japonica]